MSTPPGAPRIVFTPTDAYMRAHPASTWQALQMAAWYGRYGSVGDVLGYGNDPSMALVQALHGKRGR
jgi:hypothetical protein